MDEKFEAWMDGLSIEDKGEIIMERLGEFNVEDMLWEQFIEDEEDREHMIGEMQMEQEREDRL